MRISVSTDFKTKVQCVVGTDRYSGKYDVEVYDTLLGFAYKADNAESSEEYLTTIAKCKEYMKQLTEGSVEGFADWLVYNKSNLRYYAKVGNKVSQIYLPNTLVDKLKSMIEDGLDTLPLKKFWYRILLHPYLTQELACLIVARVLEATWLDRESSIKLQVESGLSAEEADTLSTYEDLQITKSGYIKGYKVVEKCEPVQLDPEEPEEGEDTTYVHIPRAITEESNEAELVYAPAIRCYCKKDEFYSNGVKGWRYAIGEVAHLEEEKVDRSHDRMHFGSGLYWGGLAYVEGYLGVGRELLEVLIDPADIAKITRGGYGEATTSCMFILDVLTEITELSGTIHESNYRDIQVEILADRLATLDNAGAPQSLLADINELHKTVYNGEERKTGRS